MKLFILLLVLVWSQDDYDDFGDILPPDESNIEVEIKRETKPKEGDSIYKDYDDDFVDIERPKEESEEELVIEEEIQPPLDNWSCRPLLLYSFSYEEVPSGDLVIRSACSVSLELFRGEEVDQETGVELALAE